MKIYLKDTNECKKVEIRRWSDCGYEPDCFGDLEVNFPRSHKFDQDKDAYVCSSTDYHKLVNWWEKEIAAWNNGSLGDTSDYTGYPDSIELLAS